MDGNGPKLTKMDRSGLEWTKINLIDRSGPKQTKMDKWTTMDQVDGNGLKGPKLTKMD